MAKTTNIRQRKNGLWEGRYRLNGKQCAVYGQTSRGKSEVSRPHDRN